MKFKSISQSLLIVGGFVGIGFFFQNCAGQGGFELASSIDASQSLSTPVDHPNGLSVTPSYQGPLLANRYQIQSLLMDTFKDTTIADTAGNNRVLSKILVATIVKKAGTFGVPCDSSNPALDVSAGDDCDGTIVAPMNQPATTLRAAFKIQACEQILSNDVFVNNLLKKIAGEQSEINAANLAVLWGYFYRGDDVDQNALAGLVGADQVAVKADSAIKLIDRWRLLMTVVCESTGWETL